MGDAVPRWVRLLHRALSGAVTVDNMDYVRRDAYMCGVSVGSVDVNRLIYYTFCTDEGLTFHKRALGTLRAFLNARFYMYENVYFHRVGHAIDLHLREIFRSTMALILPRSPLDDPAAYQRLSEWSLFSTVEEWLGEPLACRGVVFVGAVAIVKHRGYTVERFGCDVGLDELLFQFVALELQLAVDLAKAFDFLLQGTDEIRALCAYWLALGLA